MASSASNASMADAASVNGLGRRDAGVQPQRNSENNGMPK
jgi:hypothetical protein